MKFKVRSSVLTLYVLGTRLAGLAVIAAMVLFAATVALDGNKDVAANLPFLPGLFAAQKAAQAPYVAAISARVPHVFGGVDYAPWMFFAGLSALWVVTLLQSSRLTYFRWHLAQEVKRIDREKSIEAERAERLAAHKASVERMEREAKERADREAEARARRTAELDAQRHQVEALKAREAARVADEARQAAEAALREAEEERIAAEKRRKEEEARRLEEARRAAEAAAKAPAISAPAPAPEALAGGATHERSREELLELMAQAKKQLEKQKKSLSFLAIDVVNSTGMKVGEDPSIATRDFKHYRKLVEKAIADNNGLKAAWTPDGVMICFPTAEAAVCAAKQVIKDLEHFNAHVKAMRTDFKVRCGINTGTVLFDDTVPMEEMSDRSIDIAGHMQKYADANAIYIGKHVIEEMRSAADFQPAAKQVDGCEVYAWHPAAN